MVLLLEFRIPLPLTVEEYQVGQLYAVMEASKENTNGDTGVEILTNEPFDNERGSGQYTHKIYHMGSKVPAIVAALMPSSSLKLIEKAWNAYPHCRTEFQNPFLKERFSIVIESKHLSDNGSTENTFNLSNEELENRKIIWIDIAGDTVKDNKPTNEPSTFLSTKTGRGKLEGRWWEEGHQPIMCCYKLVTVKFQIFGFQTKVEDLIMRNQLELLTKFHKSVFCLIDQWYGLTMDDIRLLEDEAKKELDARINDLGMTPANSNDLANSVKSTPY